MVHVCPSAASHPSTLPRKSPNLNHSRTYAKFPCKSNYSRTYEDPWGGGYTRTSFRTSPSSPHPPLFSSVCRTYTENTGVCTPPYPSLLGRALQPAQSASLPIAGRFSLWPTATSCIFPYFPYAPSTMYRFFYALRTSYRNTPGGGGVA